AVLDAFTTTTPSNIIENKAIISRVRSDLIEKFLKQISSNINKVGLEFLSNDELRIFLTATFASIDSHYTISNVQESLDNFFQYVVGQSIFALRYCSLVPQISLPQQPYDAESTTDMCQVTRSANIEQDFIQVDHELWLFFNIRRVEQCHIYSNSNEGTKSISINEPALVSIPCNTSVQCIGTQMPITSCKPHRTLVEARHSSYSQAQSRIFLPIKNMTKMIVSSYESQFEKTINELLRILSSKEPSLKQILETALTYTVTAISLLLIIFFLYLFKLVKFKFQPDIKYLQSSVHKILSL
ncbi:unnamed protein product, partial [Rotaria magnacalcarata]